MIIGNNQQGTVRENINRIKGEKEENNGPLGNRYRKDDMIDNLLPKTNIMEELDPDDRGAEYEDEKDWKDFY